MFAKLYKVVSFVDWRAWQWEPYWKRIEGVSALRFKPSMLVLIPGCLFELLEVTYSVLDEDESDYIPVATNQLRRKSSSDSTLLDAYKWIYHSAPYV